MTNSLDRRDVWLAGPTTSGKSALAMKLAVQRAGTVVCADSMQLYADLRVLTARPGEADEAAVSHALYGTLDAASRHSVGDWLRSLDRLTAPRPWIVTGGTGLYFSALERGLTDVPEISAGVKADVEAELAGNGAAALHAALAREDPDGAAMLEPGDGQRIARALGVLRATGRPLRDWQHPPDPERPPNGQHRPDRACLDGGVPEVERIVLEPPRPVLRERIATRFDAMMGEGAVDEVRALLARDLDPSLPAMKAIGVREIGAMLRGETSEAAAVERAVIATRQYAKRQSTWFRNQFGPAWRRIERADEIGG